MRRSVKLFGALSPFRWILMLGFGLVVYAELNAIARPPKPTTAPTEPTSAPAAPATDAATILAETARITVRLNELPLPVVLPTPTEEPSGAGRVQWTHRVYELSLPRQTDIAPLVQPFEELKKDFPDLVVHTEDRRHALEVWLGVRGLRTHTFRFRWIDGAPKLAFVIAHLGGDIQLVRQLLMLDAPLTYAVKPFEPFSDVVREQLRLAGVPTLIELQWPTEPRPRTLMPSSDPEARPRGEERPRETSFRDALVRAQSEVPNAAGVLLLSAAPGALGTQVLPGLEEALPKSYALLWANSAEFSPTSDPCRGIVNAQRPCLVVHWNEEDENESDAQACQTRILRALARVRSTGERVEVLPGTAGCLSALRTELARVQEAGVELTTALALVRGGLSPRGQF